MTKTNRRSIDATFRHTLRIAYSKDIFNEGFKPAAPATLLAAVGGVLIQMQQDLHLQLAMFVYGKHVRRF